MYKQKLEKYVDSIRYCNERVDNSIDFLLEVIRSVSNYNKNSRPTYKGNKPWFDKERYVARSKSFKI